MHHRLLALKSTEVQRILKRNGFKLTRTKGSHQQFQGVIEGRKKRVTVIANQKRFNPKTIASMIRQSGLSEDDWLSLL
ncbi:type II toxin-antitoxin system HicA family toxin [candidate division KSB1 bacterium]|nr:type II toxin-antitoxin system HicA family toxin [candidate division KSB1 bacterium]MCH8019529.1 type II toxin-antitoxin system HicA family toxin [candidate division KSB1 bacterium]